jgi:HD superfamily phosphohydrolase
MMMSRWRWQQMADPVYGIIQFDRFNPGHQLLLDVVNSRAFQRLRRIKQMGLAEFVFPGAVHTRFNHSLGATHLMVKAIWVLKQDRKARDLLSGSFDAGLNPRITHELLLLLGILVHDLGHSALSHTLEDVLHLHAQGLSHDYYWLWQILAEDPELQALWQRHEMRELPVLLKRFMLGDETHPRHVLSYLVSSQLDMDRLDYLLRDSHFMGTRYGEIECDRIISCLDITYQHEGQPVVAVIEDGLPAVEHYLFGRHQAYKMALHSLDKASEALLAMTLKRFRYAREQGLSTGEPCPELYQLMVDGHQLPLAKYLRMDDHYLWNAIHSWSLDSEDAMLKTLAGRLMSHELPKFVDLLAYPRVPTASQERELEQAMAKHYEARGLSMEYGFERVWVEPKPLYRSDKEPIWVATREGRIVELPEVSSVANAAAPDKGSKYLWFVWDTEAKKYLQHLLTR